MSAAAFSQPFEYWVGMDTDPRTTPAALAEFDRFYSTVHVYEVMAAHPGFVGVSRYELLDSDPRGGEQRGPRWLAVYEITDEAAVLQYLKDNERPWLHRKRYSPWPPARRRAKIVWRMLWRRLSATGTTDRPPDAVFVVGLNVPDGTDAASLAGFDAGGVISADGDTRCTRLELYRAFAHPAPGCPRLCAVCDADSATDAAGRTSDAAAGPAPSSAPPVWEHPDAAWRLVYRRIPLPGLAT